MSERAALVAAIEADPDNDLPRLLFADWLDDHGDARDRVRAALIRLQCSPAAGATDRERNLVAALGRGWPAELRVPWRGIRRGFPYGLTLTTTEFADVGRRFVGREPMLEVELNASQHGFGPVDDLVRLAAGDQLRSVCRLDGYYLGPLFDSRHLTRLSEVVTHSPTDVVWMCRSPSRFALTGLSVTHYSRPSNDDGRLAVECLASDPRFARLARLELHHAGIQQDEVAILIASRSLPAGLAVTVVESDWRSDGGGPLAEALAARFPGPPAGE